MSILAPKGVKLRDFDHPEELRQEILERVQNAYKSKFPMENDRVRIDLSDLRYDNNRAFGFSDEKKALLTGNSLSVPLRGKVSLFDKELGRVIEEKDEILARVPWMTHRGTFLDSGSEYSLVAGQQRLKPGVYARRKESGELEAHINTVSGTGSGMRIFMEPETGVYRVMIGKSRIKLYPVLKGLGMDDQEIAKYWGPDILDINQKNDDNKAFGKFYEKLMGRRANKELDDKGKTSELIDELLRGELDPEVAERNLGMAEKNLSPRLLARASQKLLNIRKGLEEEDDRDSMANKNFVGPEELFEERVLKDTGQLGRSLLTRATYNRSLGSLRPGYFTPQMRGLIVGNSLSNHISGINPLEIFDYQRRVVQTGDGAIQNSESIPVSSRNVHPSQMMIIDPIRSSESKNIGVDQRFSMGARKGSDRNIYFPLRNRKTGKMEYVNAVKMSQSVVAFPKPGLLAGLAGVPNPIKEEIAEIKTPMNTPEQVEVPEREIQTPEDRNEQGASRFLNL